MHCSKVKKATFGPARTKGSFGGGPERIKRIGIDIPPAIPAASIKAPYIQAILEDEAGNLWAGSDNGTKSIINPGTHTASLILEVENAEEDEATTSSLKHSSGDIWFIARDGIRIIDAKTYYVSSFLQGARHVTFLFESNNGVVFLDSLSYGLHVWNPEAHLAACFISAVRAVSWRSILLTLSR